LNLPTGLHRQVPPAYSALKVAGRRAYALARAGERFELPERRIEIYRFDELWRHGPRRGFAIECSFGTYVRSLIAELGDAYCEELRRTAVGPFSVDDADPGEIVALNQALAFLPEERLDEEWSRRASHGGAVPAALSGPRGPVRLTDAQGLIALAESHEGEGVLKPTIVLRG
jgi:tRNA pseudouridine55 synthase